MSKKPKRILWSILAVSLLVLSGGAAVSQRYVLPLIRHGTKERKARPKAMTQMAQSQPVSCAGS